MKSKLIEYAFFISLVLLAVGGYLWSKASDIDANAKVVHAIVETELNPKLDKLNADVARVMQLPLTKFLVPSMNVIIPVFQKESLFLKNYYGVNFEFSFGEASELNALPVDKMIYDDPRFPGVSALPITFSMSAENIVSGFLFWEKLVAKSPLVIAKVKYTIADKGQITMEGNALLFGGINGSL